MAKKITRAKDFKRENNKIIKLQFQLIKILKN